MIPYIMEKTNVWNYQPASVVFMFSLLTITNGEAAMNFLQFPIGFQRAKQASQVAGPLLIAISHDPKKTYLQREFQDPKMGGTAPYKAIFSGDIPLHRPYVW